MKKTVQGFTVYREILPYIFSSLLPWMSAGEFKTEQITMFQGISLVHNFVWENLRRGEAISKCRSAKITRDEKYPVYSI